MKAMDNMSKQILTIDEVCQYTGYAKSYIYKLTAAGIIPSSKPNGKKIFFDKDKLNEWILNTTKNNNTSPTLPHEK